MVEYAILIAIMVVIFVVGMQFMESASRQRADQSLQAGEAPVPCGPELSGDACK